MRAKVVLPSIATSLLLALCTSAHATSVVVVSSHGSVNITQGGNVVRVSDSGQLTLPAQIKTGADGAIDLKDNESQIHIGPNSTVALPDAGPSGSLVDHYLQSTGSALYNIQARHGRPMSVETPYLVSVVKGTVFTISVEDGAARVTLMEGSLDVSAPGVSQHVLLKPNQSIRHSAGESSLIVIPVVAGPATIKGRSAELETSGGEEARGTQMAMVTRDLAEVGATVMTQRALTAAAAARSVPAAGAGGSPPPLNGSAGAASGSSSSAGSTTSATGSSGAGTPASGAGNASGGGSSTGTSTGTSPSGNPASSGSSSGTGVTGTSSGTGSTSSSGPSGSTGTSGNASGAGTSTGSGSTDTSGSGSSGSTNTDASGSNGKSGSSNSSGSSGNSGSGSSNSSGSDTTIVGCNGKRNGTGLGQCNGHKKP
jgi:hypothetical protein